MRLYVPQTSIVRLEIYIQKMKGKGGEKCLKQIKYIFGWSKKVREFFLLCYLGQRFRIKGRRKKWIKISPFVFL